MMKKTLLILFLTFLFAYCSHKTQESKDNVTTADYLVQDSSITKMLTANHLKLTGVKGDFESFKKYLNKLDDDSLTSIPFALDYINTCIPQDNAYRDSIYLLFISKFDSVESRLNDSLDTKYTILMGQLQNDSNTVEVNSFKNNLTTCGIGIYSTEGDYYLDVTPDYFYDNFKNRVSEGVKEYLDIRRDELNKGFSEDAGMLISFEDLYGRVKRWEKFNNQYPNTVYNKEARSFYEIYLETLMTGMDNSRVFDLDSNSLLPEIRTLYEKIKNEEPESQTTKIISSYYDFLAQHNFKDDSIDVFLKANNLSTMLAVQPHTR